MIVIAIKMIKSEGRHHNHHQQKQQQQQLEKGRTVKLLLFAIITMAQIRLGKALSDTISSGESGATSAANDLGHNHNKNHKEVPMATSLNSGIQIHNPTEPNGFAITSNVPYSPHIQQLHPTMSCFACSTMDYENTVDNLCRYMKQPYHHRSPSVGLPATSSHHLVGHQHYATDHATTTTTIPSTQTSPASGTYNYRHHQDSSVSAWHDTASSSSQAQAHQQQQLVSSNQTIVQQHRGPPASSFGSPIRTRPCFEDENFCSIVSVVRIEFVNETLISRFWAMERNCSKSCNTGCMLIGERVRLRVCSQCCRTPNCNIGSGSSSVLLSYRKNYQLLLVIICSILFLMIKQGKAKSLSSF